MHARLVASLLGAATLAGLLGFSGHACAAEDGPNAETKTGDTIRYREGGALKTRSPVTVDSADWDTVSFTSDGGRSGSVPGASVVDIEFGDAPRDYAAGWRAVATRNGKVAKDAFDACFAAKAAGVIERKWVDERANVGLGEAYLLLAVDDSSNFAKAEKAFKDALAANAKSLLAGRIFNGLVDAALGAGKPADATKHAEALVSAGRSARRPEWEIDGHFLRAEAARAAGNDAAAGVAYEEAARTASQQASATKDPAEKKQFESLERRAAAAGGWLLLDKAEASKSAGDLEKARSYFQSLPQKLGTSTDVLATVENAMGVIKLVNDDAYGALRHFQKSEVVHFGVPSEVARSLYYQAKCWEKIGNSEMRAARQRDLKDLYPKSEWARKL